MEPVVIQFIVELAYVSCHGTMTLTVNSRPLTPIGASTNNAVPMWDINDTVLPKNAECERFDDWCDGHCRRIYFEHDEDARKHTSGWAMRNTNNHNVSILKKSCLGVFLCSKRCNLSNGDIVRIRPAICDKARRKQLAKACPNAKCNGRLDLVPCRGHCGYPVTHFWRHYQGKIFFQSKGTHSHPQPELKSSAETRRHIQNYSTIGQGVPKGRTYRKRPYTTTTRLAPDYKKDNQANEVVCSCPPFEHTCTNTNTMSFPYLSSNFSYPESIPASNATHMPLCSVTFKMEYGNNTGYINNSLICDDKLPMPNTIAFSNSDIEHVSPCMPNSNYISCGVDNEQSDANIYDSLKSRAYDTGNNHMSINSNASKYYNFYYPSADEQKSDSSSDEPLMPCRIKQCEENNYETKFIDPDVLRLYQNISADKTIFSEALSIHPCATPDYQTRTDVMSSASCQYANEALPRPPSCEYEKSPVRLTELQTVATNNYDDNCNSASFFSYCGSATDQYNGQQCGVQYGSELHGQNGENVDRCHGTSRQSYIDTDERTSADTLGSVVNHTPHIHNRNINITLKYN